MRSCIDSKTKHKRLWVTGWSLGSGGGGWSYDTSACKRTQTNSQVLALAVNKQHDRQQLITTLNSSHNGDVLRAATSSTIEQTLRTKYMYMHFAQSLWFTAIVSEPTGYSEQYSEIRISVQLWTPLPHVAWPPPPPSPTIHISVDRQSGSLHVWAKQQVNWRSFN